jgi:hypothetical protein
MLGSCGYVSDKPPSNLNVYKADQLQACKIDIDKLGEIFKENQEEQIRCLKENFIQYTKYVKTANSDSVNQGELGDFVKKIFQGQSDSIVKGLSIIFQLNMILLKDEAQKISKGNITPLFELLVTANREAIIITNTIQDMGKPENQDRFFEIRDVFKASLERFAEATLKIMATKSAEAKDQTLNIKDFIIDASTKLGNKEVDPEVIESLLFAKQVLVSGNKELITTSELQTLIKKIPKLLTLTFDIYYSTSKNFKNEAQQSNYYLQEIKSLYTIIDFKQNDFKLITVDQLLKVIKTYYKDSKIDIVKFKPTIIALKSKIIGGNPEVITLNDLKKSLDLVVEVNERVYFDYVTFDVRSDLLKNTKRKLSYQELSPINPTEYSILSTNKIAELTKNFNQLAVEFKYLRESSTTLPYYGTLYKRSKYGMVETSLFRWFGNKMIKGYGHIENGESQVSLLEFQNFLVDMKPVLEEFKLWSPNFETFARNAVLLADLFQNQSNGDGLVNEREATEYIGMILSASQASDDFRNRLKDYCDPGINTEDSLFDVKCFNDHFFEVFLNHVNYKKYFPRMAEYVNASPLTEVQAYLRGIEGFARDINDPKLPINKRDNILILGSMINVETTFLRFDTNLDNTIDYNELMEAFKVYRPSIIALAKLSKEQEVYAPSIFLYMVSKMEIPPNNDWMDNLKFYSFHKCVSSNFCRTTVLDPIVAKRLNIGTLLYYLVNQTGAKPIAKTR